MICLYFDYLMKRCNERVMRDGDTEKKNAMSGQQFFGFYIIKTDLLYFVFSNKIKHNTLISQNLKEKNQHSTCVCLRVRARVCIYVRIYTPYRYTIYMTLSRPSSAPAW